MRVIVALLAVLLTLPLFSQNKSEIDNYIANKEKQYIEVLKESPWQTSWDDYYDFWEDFILLLQTYPEASFKYDFDNLLNKQDETRFLTYTESDDKTIKYYFLYEGGSSRGGMGQFVYCYYQNLYSSSDGLSSNIVSRTKVEDGIYIILCTSVGSLPSLVHTVYLAEFKEKVKILDQKTVTFDGGDRLDRYHISRSIECIKVDSLAHIHIPFIVPIKNKPEHSTCGEVMSGQYDLYVVEDGRFKLFEHEGDPYINESLKRYHELATTYYTQKFILRVDDMGSDSYRYACWNLPNEIDNAPNIIIHGGVYEKAKERYKFENGGYVYFVGDGFAESNRYVEVWKDNKLILRDLPSKKTL